MKQLGGLAGELARASDLGLHGGKGGRGPLARSRTRRATRAGGGRAVDGGRMAVLNEQCPRVNETGQLGIAELAEQAEEIAINGLLPEPLPGIEIAADQRRRDAGVQGRRMQRDEAAFRMTGNGDRSLAGAGLRVPQLEPVHERERLLHLEADHGPAQHERLPVNPFAMRLVGEPDARVAGPLVAAVNQHRDDHPATSGGKGARPLAGWRNAWREPRKLLRRLVRIRQRNHLGARR